MALLSRLFGNARRFETAIADYPVFQWPHPGEGYLLTPAQRRENLAHFLAQLPTRIALIRSTLHELGVDIPPPEHVSAGSPVSGQLHEFARATLSKVKGIEALCAHGWRTRSYDGRDARVVSFVHDIGIYCGTCTTNDPPGFAWAIDDTRYSATSRMGSADNVVIYKHIPFEPRAIRRFHDVIGWTMYAVFDEARVATGKTIGKVNAFRFLDDHLEGGHG